MRGIFLIIFIFPLFLIQPVQAAKSRNHLEELLIWKMSEELKLTSIEEKKFTEIYKGLNAKKMELNVQLLESIEKMRKGDSKLKETELSRYRKTLANYNRLSEEEFDKLKPLLGAERMVQYLSIKQDLTNRIKALLTSPEANKDGSSKLPQPRVIEEK